MVLLLVLPGGLLVLTGMLFTRACVQAHRIARQNSGGAAVSFRTVLASIHVRDVLREARLAR